MTHSHQHRIQEHVINISSAIVVTWGVRASAWQTRVLTVVKCQLNE